MKAVIGQIERDLSLAFDLLSDRANRLREAEAKHDAALTPWGKRRAHTRAVVLIGEVKAAKQAVRDRQHELALARWHEATLEAQRLHQVADDASAERAPAATVKAAWDAHERAVDYAASLRPAIELFKPVTDQ